MVAVIGVLWRGGETHGVWGEDSHFLGLKNSPNLVFIFQISGENFMASARGLVKSSMSRIYLLVRRWYRWRRDTKYGGWKNYLWLSGTTHSKIHFDGVVTQRYYLGRWSVAELYFPALVIGLKFVPGYEFRIFCSCDLVYRSCLPMSGSNFQSGLFCPVYGYGPRQGLTNDMGQVQNALFGY